MPYNLLQREGERCGFILNYQQLEVLLRHCAGPTSSIEMDASPEQILADLAQYKGRGITPDHVLYIDKLRFRDILLYHVHYRGLPHEHLREELQLAKELAAVFTPEVAWTKYILPFVWHPTGVPGERVLDIDELVKLVRAVLPDCGLSAEYLLSRFSRMQGLVKFPAYREAGWQPRMVLFDDWETDLRVALDYENLDRTTIRVSGNKVYSTSKAHRQHQTSLVLSRHDDYLPFFAHGIPRVWDYIAQFEQGIAGH